MEKRPALDWVLISPISKLLYVEVPKAACTKIRTLLILLNQPDNNLELAEFLKTAKPAPYYHWEFGVIDNRSLAPDKLSTFLAHPDYFKFAFVRNPYARLVSAYTDKVHQAVYQGNEYYTHVAKKIKAEASWQPSGQITTFLAKAYCQIEAATQRQKMSDSVVKPQDFQDDPATSSNGYDYVQIAKRIQGNYGKKTAPPSVSRISEKMKMRLLDYPNLAAIDLKQTPVSFAEFIHFVCAQPSTTMDVHWRPQTVCLDYDAITYDFIGRVEDFDQDMTTLFNKIDAPAYAYAYIQGKMNVVKKKQEQTIWTDELADMVYAKYQSDFEAFGYDKLSYRT